MRKVIACRKKRTNLLKLQLNIIITHIEKQITLTFFPFYSRILIMHISNLYNLRFINKCLNSKF